MRGSRPLATGTRYFPLLVPESLLAKEAAHVEGFAPQVAWVTQAGKDQLEERLAIRPTSEAIIGTMYAKWIQSWRDLPVLINQWANVMRWEMVTRLFLRTTEFLWQEGHTAHRTEEEAQEETLRMLEVYRDFIETELAIPIIKGQKTEREKFAGAEKTYSVEALMRDGRGLQAGTSHNLGQHFSEVFGIDFQDIDGKRRYVWQTSWGVSTRLIGAVIMVHGDDAGLILPPNVAPIQTIIVPIWKSEAEQEVVQQAVGEVQDTLPKHLRIEADMRAEYTPGWKFNEWELRGVPVRMEIGPKDVQKKQVVLARRDNRKKEFIPAEELSARLPALLQEIQRDLFQRALAFREENTRQASSFEELGSIISEKRGYVEAFWCGDAKCEEEIQAKTGATIRCIPFDAREKGRSHCILCGTESGLKVVFAKAY